MREEGVRDRLERAMLGVLVVGCLLVLSTSHRVDPDLWGHVRYGQEVLAARALPPTATHTYTAEGYPWVNHENLAEIVFGWLATHFGAPGLNAFNSLLGLLVLALMVRNAVRERVSFLVLSLVVLLAASAMGAGWTVRPQLFTYTCFALLLVLLERSFRAGAPYLRALWLAPPLFTFWVNAHGGFLAGLAVLALYLGGRAAQSLWRDRRGALGELRTYALVLCACGLATLVNPYGPRMLAWIVADLAPPRPEIGEWHALAPPDVLFFVWATLVVLFAAAWLWGRLDDPGQIAVLTVIVVQSYLHGRHTPFLGLLAGFWLPLPLERVRARWRTGTREQRGAPPSARAIRLFQGAAGGIVLALLVTLAFQSRTLWVNRARYPVDALQFMADRRLEGKLVVHFDWAQYALAALAPGTTVAFDGRLRTCYPQDVADLYFDFLLGNYPAIRWRSPDSPSFDDTAILRLREPDLVLVSRRFKHSVKVMKHARGWVLLYQDGIAQLWGRRERYDETARPEYVPAQARRIADAMPRGYVRWPAFPVAGTG